MNKGANITFSSDAISLFQYPLIFPSSLNLPKRINSRFPLSSNSYNFSFNQLLHQNSTNNTVLASVATHEAMNIVICGAPASGKGTQCEFIVKKYGLVHVAVGDLLRDEVEDGTENGKRVRECMEKGKLVPNELVTTMVRDRLLKPDCKESGWLLDGYPRSPSQATALMKFGLRPNMFIQLEVPDDILVKRVTGRRLDPVTGKIYHLQHLLPETDEIAARLTRRFDDTEQKVKLRLLTHHENSELVLDIFKHILVKIDGNAPIRQVFSNIDRAILDIFVK